MESDFGSAQGRFEKTIRWLRQGKQCFTNTLYSEGGVLLTSTGNVIRHWKEYLEDLLNPSNMSSMEEAESVDCEVGLPNRREAGR